jgi:hypothetical protein
MIHFTDMTGLLGNAAALAAVGVALPGIRRLARAHRAGMAAAILFASLVPFGGMPLAGYLRGAIGDLSVATLLLLGASLWRSLREGAVPAGKKELLLLIALASGPFYSMALGWGGLDPYRLGYGNYGFLACLLVLALWAAQRRLPLLAAALALPVLAWSAGWYESTNLWDYLLDPLVAAYAISSLVAQGAHRILRRNRHA